MAEIAEIVRLSRNNDLSSDEDIFEYLQKVGSKVDSDELEPDNKEYLDYLMKIDTDFSFQEMFDSDSPPDYIDLDPVSYEKVTKDLSPVRFTGFTASLIYSIQENSINEFQDTYDNYSEEFEESGYELMKLFDSYQIHRQSYQFDADKIQLSIKQAYEVCEAGPQHPLSFRNFANAVITAFENNPDFDPSFDEIPDNKTELLKIAYDRADSATTVENENSSNHITLARICALRGEFGERKYFADARTHVSQALEITSSSQQVDLQRRERYRRFQQNINLRERSTDLENRVADADSALESIEKELQNAVEKYRKNTLRFIGFFAALITLAVTSTQLLTRIDASPGEVGGLLITLSGALIFAFGGFGLLLPSLDDDRIENKKARSVIVLGLLAMVGGFILSTAM